MGSLVKLGPGCRQNTEHRTQNTGTMDSRILISATALVLLCLVDTGSSIKCHQCNSYDNFHCGDPFYFEDTPDEQKTQKFLAECPADGKEYFCCADCCGSGLPASLDHAAISTQTVP